VTEARLASYDRAITSEPSFSAEQAPGLKRDLTDYLATLRVRLLCWFQSRHRASRCASLRRCSSFGAGVASACCWVPCLHLARAPSPCRKRRAAGTP